MNKHDLDKLNAFIYSRYGHWSGEMRAAMRDAISNAEKAIEERFFPAMKPLQPMEVDDETK